MLLVLALRLLQKRVHVVGSSTTGLLMQVCLLLDLARECAFSVRELEATGLPFALAALAPVDAAGQRELLTRQLDLAPEGVVALACSVVAVIVCLAGVQLVQGAVGLGASIGRHRWRVAWPAWRLPRCRVTMRSLRGAW